VSHIAHLEETLRKAGIAYAEPPTTRGEDWVEVEGGARVDEEGEEMEMDERDTKGWQEEERSRGS